MFEVGHSRKVFIHKEIAEKNQVALVAHGAVGEAASTHACACQLWACGMGSTRAPYA